MTQTTGKRILLGQLAARGDCLYATAIARQIKHDYPGCRLTWAIGTMCRSILDGNPYVDEIWEIPVADHDAVYAAWYAFFSMAQLRLQRGEFDEAFFTQIYPANYRNYDCTVRASIFRGYPHKITVPVAPVVQLREDEIENVRRFAAHHELHAHAPVILFEFSGSSGQTFVNPQFAYSAACGILAQLPSSRIIMSSLIEIESHDPRIISGHSLSFRENAELTKYCSLLIGCSSGITWLTTSEWAKPLPMVQLLDRTKGVYASIVHDHEHFGLPTEDIIEMTDCPAEDLVDCVVTACKEGFHVAKKHYHVRLQLAFDHYDPTLLYFIRNGEYRVALQSNWNILRRYGPRRAVIKLNLRTLKYLVRHATKRAAARVRTWLRIKRSDKSAS